MLRSVPMTFATMTGAWRMAHVFRRGANCMTQVSAKGPKDVFGKDGGECAQSDRGDPGGVPRSRGSPSAMHYRGLVTVSGTLKQYPYGSLATHRQALHLRSR